MSDFRGISEDAVIARLASGETITSIAKSVNTAHSSLCDWLDANADRSARARASRMRASRAWDEMGEEGIRQASDPFELARAKELAHHLRWRASKADPTGYGEKQTHEVKAAITLTLAPIDASV